MQFQGLKREQKQSESCAVIKKIKVKKLHILLHIEFISIIIRSASSVLCRYEITCHSGVYKNICIQIIMCGAYLIKISSAVTDAEGATCITARHF